MWCLVLKPFLFTLRSKKYSFVLSFVKVKAKLLQSLLKRKKKNFGDLK